MAKSDYVPALRFEFLTRYYDPLVKFSTREKTFKAALLKQARLADGQKILDVACGTGTLLLEIKKKFPRTEAFGIDVDAAMLDKARQKARRDNLNITFDKSYSDDLPFADNSFDRVFSTLFFHHLTPARKNRTFREILRVLRPAGEFHLADYALPRDRAQFVLSKWVRIIDGFETTRDNLRGRLPAMMEASGFRRVRRTNYFKTILGTIRLFEALK